MEMVTLLEELISEVKGLREDLSRKSELPAASPLTKDQAAKFLQISTRQLDNLIAAGHIPCTRVGLKPMFLRANLERYLQERTGISRAELERQITKL